MSVKVILENVRGSFVYLLEPYAFKDHPNDPRYRITALIPKDSDQLKLIRRAIKQAAVEKFGEKVNMEALKLCLRDGDTQDKDGYEGHYFINTSNKQEVSIRNQQNQPADEEDLKDYCFSGAYFHISINFVGYDAKVQKGVAAYVNSVMLHKKGDRLGGDRGDPKSDFQEFAQPAKASKKGDGSVSFSADDHNWDDDAQDDWGSRD